MLKPDMNEIKQHENEKLNIGIDLDGTVTVYDYWLARANTYFGRQIKPEAITVYNIAQILGITSEDYASFYRLNGENVHRESAIRPDAARVIHALRPQHRIHYISARDPYLWRVSMEWLTRHDLPLDSLSLLGSPHKSGRAQELACDIFIEDSLENALELAQDGIRVLLIDCPYNQGLLPQGITRVASWAQVEQAILVRQPWIDRSSRSA
jgi:uncharacterized protein